MTELTPPSKGRVHTHIIRKKYNENIEEDVEVEGNETPLGRLWEKTERANNIRY